MPLSVTPPPSGMTAPAPLSIQPADLQPALDRLHAAFREGFINEQDLQKRTEIGTSDAQAQRTQNEAAKAKAEQDRKDQQGGKGYTKPGTFARLTGIGTAPKPTIPQPTIGPSSPVNPNAGANEGGAEPTTMPSPYLQAASADDFNPVHESTDDLLNLVREGGYSFP
jgi:hypothetical protein